MVVLIVGLQIRGTLVPVPPRPRGRRGRRRGRRVQRVGGLVVVMMQQLVVQRVPLRLQTAAQMVIARGRGCCGRGGVRGQNRGRRVVDRVVGRGVALIVVAGRRAAGCALGRGQVNHARAAAFLAQLPNNSR